MRWLALAVALIASLAAAEGVVRLLPENVLGFRYEEGRFKRPRDGTPDKSANKLGFRDIDHGPRAAGVRRLYLIGDSYVHGIYCNVSQSVGRRLQHHLDAQAAGKFEVVAFGRGGWGQRAELDALKRLGRLESGDLVVTLALTFNDIVDNWPKLRGKSLDQRRQVSLYRPGWLEFPAEKAPGLIFRWSALNRLISHRLYQWTRDRSSDGIPMDYQVYAVEPPPGWPRAWQETETLIDATREYAEKAGAGYAVVAASTPHGALGADRGLSQLMAAYPEMKKSRWDLDAPDRKLGEICRAHGIPFLALEPEFRTQTAAGRTLHWASDGHWNHEGNDLAGSMIADFVLKLSAAGNHSSRTEAPTSAPAAAPSP